MWVLGAEDNSANVFLKNRRRKNLQLRHSPTMNIPLKLVAMNSDWAAPHTRQLLLAGALWLAGAAAPVFGQAFTPGDLLLSYSVYTGDASTVTIGQALPGGGGMQRRTGVIRMFFRMTRRIRASE